MAQEGLGAFVLLLMLAFLVLQIASMWRLFTKAGQPGWGCLVPIYNTYLLVKIGGNPWWYLLLLFVPLVNIYILFKMHVDVARAFGKGIGWGIGLVFVGFVLYPILAFGGATYQGPGGGGVAGGAAA